MTPEEREQLRARYDGLEAAIRKILDRPRYLKRFGNIVLDADGNPVINHRPNRDAERLLKQIQAERARILGDPAPRENRHD